MTIVNSSFVSPAGVAINVGTITYTPTALRRVDEDILIPAHVEVAIVDGDGTSPDLTPGTYEVRIESDWFLEAYSIVVPATGPVALVDLIDP